MTVYKLLPTRSESHSDRKPAVRPLYHRQTLLAPENAVELFVRKEDAVAAMEAAIADEPDWVSLLRVEPVDLDDTQPTLN